MAETPVQISPSRLVSYDVARQSPCSACPSWCCTRLPLHNFSIRNLVDLDHARYLLNFEDIELGLYQSGEWTAHYLAPCRHLTSDRRCSVHGTSAQPIICTTYNEYSCWYKRVLPDEPKTEFVRIDHARMAVLVQHISFDDSGGIAGMPEWSALPQLFASLELPADDLAANNGNGAAPFEATPPAATPPPAPAPQLRSALAVLNSDPCQGCAAYCCTHLMFPLSTPVNVGGLDYLRFALGFPGVEAVVTGDAWSLALSTRCRHLDGSRCGIYGQPERPMVCGHYDGRTCGYRPMFGPVEGAASVRFSFEQLDRLLGAVEVGPDGGITAMPSLDELRRIVRPSPS